MVGSEPLKKEALKTTLCRRLGNLMSTDQLAFVIRCGTTEDHPPPVQATSLCAQMRALSALISENGNPNATEAATLATAALCRVPYRRSTPR